MLCAASRCNDAHTAPPPARFYWDCKSLASLGRGEEEVRPSPAPQTAPAAAPAKPEPQLAPADAEPAPATGEVADDAKAPAPADEPAAPAPAGEPVAAPKEAEPAEGEEGALLPLPPQLPEDRVAAPGDEGTGAVSDASAGNKAEPAAPQPDALGDDVPLPAPVNATAPEAPADASAPVTLGLTFGGVSAGDFKAQYAAGSRAAVADLAGVPVAAVEETITPAPSGARRLLRALLQAAPAPAPSGVAVT